jgi:hypothetical protein
MLVIFGLIVAQPSTAKMIRCKGEYTCLNTEKAKIRIDIVLPEKLDMVLTLSDFPSGEPKAIVRNRMVGKGIIEILWDKRTTPDINELIVTQLPDSNFSLYGFFMDYHVPVTIRIDLLELPNGKKANRFFLFEPYRMDQAIQGECEE